MKTKEVFVVLHHNKTFTPDCHGGDYVTDNVEVFGVYVVDDKHEMRQKFNLAKKFSSPTFEIVRKQMQIGII